MHIWHDHFVTYCILPMDDFLFSMDEYHITHLQQKIKEIYLYITMSVSSRKEFVLNCTFYISSVRIDSKNCVILETHEYIDRCSREVRNFLSSISIIHTRGFLRATIIATIVTFTNYRNFRKYPCISIN